MNEYRSHNTAPGWYQDPGNLSRSRYWDGQSWTEHVTTAPTHESQRPVSRPAAATTTDRKPVSLFNAKQRVQELQTEVDQLKALLDRMGLADAPLIERENTRLRTELTELQRQRAAIVEHIGAARATLIHTQDLQELQAVGYYRYHHPAETSVQLKNELLRVQAAIKESIKNKTAITAATGFTFNGSIAQGSKFVSEMSRIMLRAYNVEAENCVKTVKAGNLSAAAQRLFKAGEQIMKQGQMINLRIADHYHRLRISELELAADVHMMVQREKAQVDR